MNADGTKPKLLTPFSKAKRSYRTGPDWSPTGDAVAYEQQNGDFQVWMINIKTGKMTQLTKFKENEDPSWAPDGRHMAITSTRGGTREIWVLDTKTGKFRQLSHVDGARLASWSPVLHPLP
jgi:TolB protein